MTTFFKLYFAFTLNDKNHILYFRLIDTVPTLSDVRLAYAAWNRRDETDRLKSMQWKEWASIADASGVFVCLPISNGDYIS